MIKTFGNQSLIVGLASLLLCATSCFAKGKKEKDYGPIKRSEVIMKSGIGDSISNIILRAHRVEISTDSCTTKKLNAEEKAVVKYLIADSCNFSSDTKVYGEFVPSLCIKFKRYKKVVFVLYDFRLRKWMMKDADEQLLCLYDLKSTDILRFALLALPQDKYLNELIKEQSK